MSPAVVRIRSSRESTRLAARRMDAWRQRDSPVPSGSAPFCAKPPGQPNSTVSRLSEMAKTQELRSPPMEGLQMSRR